MKEKRNLLIAGGIVGAASVVLVLLGNPANMGFCIACFLRDIAGGIGLHRAEIVQYIRPEILGLVAGAFILSVIRGEFKPRGGSSPVTRFILGACVMIGALVFLGCPLRMVLRIAGGDFNALVGLAGFVAGILCGTFFLNKGFSLKRTYKQTVVEGVAVTGIQIGLFILLLSGASFLFFSQSGPGSMHAPILVALAAGLIVGAVSQRTRLCMAGGIRDLFLFRDWTLLCGFIAIFVVAFLGNLLLGQFHPGFMIDAETAQPVAHTDGLWNFIGMLAVGFGSVLLGGCPLRQLILAGEGNSDSAITVLGMVVGAAISHNFSLASSGTGTGANGKVGAIVVLAIILVIACINTFGKSKESAPETVVVSGVKTEEAKLS